MSEVLRLAIGELVLPEGLVRLARGGTRKLTRIEAALAGFLVAHAGRPVPRRTLMREVWGYAEGTESRTLDTTIKTLRRKIEADPRQPQLLRTVHGVGYRLDRLPAGTRESDMKAWCFAVAIVRKGHRFLLVQEKDGTWYFPAGRLELGETFSKAAVRECMEESGVPVQLTGIYRVEHSPSREGARFRVLFAAHPVDDTPPRTFPNPDTLGARWVTMDEASRMPLRGVEVPDVMRAVLGGAPIYPTRLLLPELSRWD